MQQDIEPEIERLEEPTCQEHSQYRGKDDNPVDPLTTLLALYYAHAIISEEV
jgi:hypothetical protein